MSQAPVELTDPLVPADAESSAATDDLLAQMAGDEIDRLLAEGDSQDVPLAASQISAPPAVVINNRVATAMPDASVATLAEPDASTGADAVKSAEAELEGELDQLLANLDKKPSKSTAEPPVAVEGTIVAELHIPTRAEGQDATSTLTSVSAEKETGSAERSALAHVESVDFGKGRRLGALRMSTSLFIKPLIWINAPFGSISDSTRSALGKVAVITLLNAAAVLAYVVISRKH